MINHANLVIFCKKQCKDYPALQPFDSQFFTSYACVPWGAGIKRKLLLDRGLCVKAVVRHRGMIDVINRRMVFVAFENFQ